MKSDILELLAESRDGVYAVDMRQRIIFWNQAAERILGRTAEELLGQFCYRALSGLSEDDAHVCTPDCAGMLWARRGKVPPSHTVLTHTKNGEPKWISITHVLLPASSRDLDTLVHLFHDATEEVEAKRLVQQLGGLLSKAPQSPSAHSSSNHEPNNNAAGLSPRELEVVRLLAQGAGTRDLAEKLVISNTTVRNHIQRILAKLGVHNRLEAVAVASREGLL